MGLSENSHEILDSPGGCKWFPSPELQPPEPRAGPESRLESHCPQCLQQGAAPVLEMGGGRGTKPKKYHPPRTFWKSHQLEEKSFRFAPPSLALAVPPQGRRPEPRLQGGPSPSVSSDPGAGVWGAPALHPRPAHQAQVRSTKGSVRLGWGPGAGRTSCHCLLPRSHSCFLLYL